MHSSSRCTLTQLRRIFPHDDCAAPRFGSLTGHWRQTNAQPLHPSAAASATRPHAHTAHQRAVASHSTTASARPLPLPRAQSRVDAAISAVPAATLLAMDNGHRICRRCSNLAFRNQRATAGDVPLHSAGTTTDAARSEVAAGRGSSCARASHAAKRCTAHAAALRHQQSGRAYEQPR